MVDVAWIAGVGASTGLGAALGRRFARAGLAVALTGRNTDRVSATAAEIVKSGNRVQAVPGDVSSSEDIQRLTAEVAALGSLRRTAWTHEVDLRPYKESF